jgi:hypothetical protein
MARTYGIVFVWISCIALLSGCVAYEPVPVYYPSPASAPTHTFDRAWNAALEALKETGVRIASADPARGLIRGSRDQTDVTVSVARLPNGTLQVEIEAAGPKGRDPGLASRISEAYQRRMGG